MLHASARSHVAVAKPADDRAWRGRTFTACGLFAGGVVAIAAANLDWSEGAAMVLGQLAGMVAPLVMIGACVWGAVALIGRKA